MSKSKKNQPELPAHDPETGEVLDQEKPFLRSLGLRPVVLDERGRERLDPTPMAPPVGWKPTPSMVEIMRAQIRNELSQAADQEGFETWDEANDFDVQDDFDPSTPYEEMFDPAPSRPHFETAEETLNLRRDRPARPAPRQAEPKPAKEAVQEGTASTPSKEMPAKAGEKPADGKKE